MCVYICLTCLKLSYNESCPPDLSSCLFFLSSCRLYTYLIYHDYLSHPSQNYWRIWSHLLLPFRTKLQELRRMATWLIETSQGLKLTVSITNDGCQFMSSKGQVFTTKIPDDLDAIISPWTWSSFCMFVAFDAVAFDPKVRENVTGPMSHWCISWNGYRCPKATDIINAMVSSATSKWVRVTFCWMEFAPLCANFAFDRMACKHFANSIHVPALPYATLRAEPEFFSGKTTWLTTLETS